MIIIRLFNRKNHLFTGWIRYIGIRSDMETGDYCIPAGIGIINREIAGNETTA